MKDYIKMISALTAIAAACGLLLSVVKKGTENRIEEQVLYNVQGPAVKDLFGYTEKIDEVMPNIMRSRQQITVEEQARSIFVDKQDDKARAVAFECEAMGFKDKIVIIVGFDLEKDSLSGIGIISHKETPGLGARITEAVFRDIFKDKALAETFKVKQDGGIVDAISGATISSRAVCAAVENGIALYPAVKEEIMKKINKNGI
ncbi:MAG: RnfABCDGE type electron transport complex subunit G [Candidatus Aminicenantes bacterium]|nr:RnfABCDGE type electron transport complex subunit G [Candidatus Aminicenantes bacterium]